MANHSKSVTKPKAGTARRWLTTGRLLMGGLVIAASTLVFMRHDDDGSAKGGGSGSAKGGADESATGKPETPPSKASLEAGHEVTDVSERGIVYILAGLAATTALVIGIVFIMIWQFNMDRTHAFASVTQAQKSQPVPPAPHLQISPFADLARYRGRQERILHSYGWTSADHSTARIPISRAMALTIGKSLDGSP